MPRETTMQETAAPRGVSRGRQRLGGAFIALLSGAFVAWSWYTALTRGYYYRKAALIFPAFLVIGVALLLIPGYREERIARGEDVSRLEGAQLITARWWAVLALALAASFANAYFINGG
jgi:ABC-type Fe3+-siderophore transport system permease subunit